MRHKLTESVLRQISNYKEDYDYDDDDDDDDKNNDNNNNNKYKIHPITCHEGPEGK